MNKLCTNIDAQYLHFLYKADIICLFNNEAAQNPVRSEEDA